VSLGGGGMKRDIRKRGKICKKKEDKGKIEER
jgi:hypothetical protein